MEENKEPMPGYLGASLSGHREPVPANAWEKIEAGLDRRKRRGFWFWLFGGIGLLLLGSTLWFSFREETTRQPIAQHWNRQPESEGAASTPTQRPKERIGEEEPARNRDKEPASLQQIPSDTVADTKPIRLEQRQAVTNSSAKPTIRPQTISPAHPPQTTLLKNQTETVARSTPITPKTRRGTTSTLARLSPLKKQAGQPVPGPDEENPTTGMSLAERRQMALAQPKTETAESREAAATAPNEKPGSVADPKANRIGVSDPVPAPSTNPGIDSTSVHNPEEGYKPASQLAHTDSLKKAESTPAVAMDSANAAPEAHTEKPALRRPFWLLSLHLGIMQQDIRYTQNSTVLFSAADVPPAYSARALFGRLWPLFRTLLVGVDGSLHLIQQRVKVKRPSPTTYTYSADSLTIIAKTEYNTVESLYRNTLLAGFNIRFQWKPVWSPIGLQGRTVIASYKWDLPNPFTDAWELGNSQELGIWIPIKTKSQISLDFNQMGWKTEGLPLPVPNRGKNRIVSLGFTRKW